LAQVKGERMLVARLHMPPERGAVLELAPFAQRIAGARRLDLDHLGTELAQQLAGEGAGDQLTHFDDLDALQGQGIAELFHGYLPECVVPGEHDRGLPCGQSRPLVCPVYAWKSRSGSWR